MYSPIPLESSVVISIKEMSLSTRSPDIGMQPQELKQCPSSAFLHSNNQNMGQLSLHAVNRWRKVIFTIHQSHKRFRVPSFPTRDFKVIVIRLVLFRDDVNLLKLCFLAIILIIITILIGWFMEVTGESPAALDEADI